MSKNKVFEGGIIKGSFCLNFCSTEIFCSKFSVEQSQVCSARILKSVQQNLKHSDFVGAKSCGAGVKVRIGLYFWIFSAFFQGCQQVRV